MYEWPPPQIPQWAVAAGCPSPQEGETFEDYVARLGLDYAHLVADLDPRTAELANIRLASELRRGNPTAFDRYVERRLLDERSQHEV